MLEAAGEIQAATKDTDVIIATDETFFCWHPHDCTCVAPKGGKHVSGIVGADDKGGATVALSVEYYSNQILGLYVIQTGVTTSHQAAVLCNVYKDHHKSGCGKAPCGFHLQHWMNAEMWIIFLEDVKELHPGKQVAIISDYYQANTDWLVVVFIPGSVTDHADL